MEESKINNSISTIKNSAIDGGVNNDLIKKCVLYAVAIVILIIIVYACYYIKETYMTEQVRSDSDREGWDLRKSINTYLKKQDDYLKNRANY